MASVNTNAAAITALRTLQNTNASMDKTQAHISTGYKIGEAKDNAAYWAISTTLKSDNKSLATVKDALGLGASTVDTAYQGLNKAKDVLDEIKSKLTAATQDGVDRDTIQAEIKQLQDQLKSIATSSVFSGENWLSTDTSAVSYNANKTVVASFSRDNSGSVSIGTIGVDISKVALFDASTVANTGGIIDGAVNLKGKDGRDLTIGGTDVTTGSPTLGGLTATPTGGAAGGITAGATPATNTTGVDTKAGVYKAAAAFAVTVTSGTYTPNAGDKITLNFKLDGGSTISVDVPGVGGTPDIRAITVDNVIAALNADTGVGHFAEKAVASKDANNFLVITSKSTGANSKIETVAPSTATAGGGGTPVFAYGGYAAQAPTVPNGGTGLDEVKAANTTGAAVTLSTTTSGLTATDKVSFDLTIDGASVKTTVARGGAVGSTDADLQTILMNSLNVDAAFTAKATASMNSGKLVITSKATGVAGSVVVNSVSFSDSNGTAKNVSASGFNNVVNAASFASNTFSAITLDADDNLYFKVQVDDATAATNVTINKDLIDKALKDVANHVSGTITSVGDYKTVIEAALKAVNLDSKVAVSVTGVSSDKITLASKTLGANSKLAITETLASKGGDKISIENMDISAAGFAKLNVSSSDDVKKVLTAYIDAVNTAITKVTSAASSLGSVASRIDLQKSFVDTLMDTIDKGVGNLIDADMSEESTKLQALQVKQQLGVQALSIANQASQSILSLFRS